MRAPRERLEDILEAINRIDATLRGDGKTLRRMNSSRTGSFDTSRSSEKQYARCRKRCSSVLLRCPGQRLWGCATFSCTITSPSTQI